MRGHDGCRQDSHTVFRPKLTVTTFSNDRTYTHECGNAFLPKTCYGQAFGTGVVTSSPSGMSCGAGEGTTTTCTATFDDGSLVTLTALPTCNSTFAGWGGPCAASGLTCQVSMSDARTVFAYLVA